MKGIARLLILLIMIALMGCATTSEKKKQSFETDTSPGEVGVDIHK